MNGLKSYNKIFKTMRYATGNQYRALSSGVIWQKFAFFEYKARSKLLDSLNVPEFDKPVSHIP